MAMKVYLVDYNIYKNTIRYFKLKMKMFKLK